MNRNSASKVGKCEGTLTIATIGCSDQLKQRFVLRDGEQLTLAEHPAGGSKVTREHANFSDIRLCHLFLLLIGRGEYSLKGNAERQRQEWLHIEMRLAATNSSDLARCHSLKIEWIAISIIDYAKERVVGWCVRIRGVGCTIRNV